MYRLMQPSDRAAVVALWQKERGDTAEFINTAMDRFAGEQNVYVAEENGQIEAAAPEVQRQVEEARRVQKEQSKQPEHHERRNDRWM